jgi:hypothetical protein
VDATRAQLQSITKMQIQVMDHMMDVWEEQIKSPNPMTAPSTMLSKLKSLPGVPAGTRPSADALAGAAMNPMQFWVQWAEQCQKAWADAVGLAAADSAAADYTEGQTRKVDLGERPQPRGSQTRQFSGGAGRFFIHILDNDRSIVK